MAFGCVTGLAFGLPLTYSYGGARTFGYLAGAAGLSVVLIYLAVNLSAIRAFRTELRSEFRVWRHLVIPASAVVFFLFPLWGILHPRGRALMDLLPFTALGWLGLGLSPSASCGPGGRPASRRWARFSCRPTIVAGCPGTLNAAGEPTESPRQG